MKTRIVGLALAFLIPSVAARADTITITSGMVQFSLVNGDTQARLIGADTDIVAVGMNPGSLVFPAGDVGPLQPNGSLHVAATGPELVGGTFFPYPNHLDATLAFLLSPFQTGMFADSTTTFLTPFSLSGIVMVRDPDGVILSTSNLAGGGIAYVTASPQPARIPHFETRNIGFEFTESAPSPTPEPASLLLFGAGVVGFFARAKRHSW